MFLYPSNQALTDLPLAACREGLSSCQAQAVQGAAPYSHC